MFLRTENLLRKSETTPAFQPEGRQTKSCSSASAGVLSPGVVVSKGSNKQHDDSALLFPPMKMICHQMNWTDPHGSLDGAFWFPLYFLCLFSFWNYLIAIDFHWGFPQVRNFIWKRQFICAGKNRFIPAPYNREEEEKCSHGGIRYRQQQCVDSSASCCCVTMGFRWVKQGGTWCRFQQARWQNGCTHFDHLSLGIKIVPQLSGCVCTYHGCRARWKRVTKQRRWMMVWIITLRKAWRFEISGLEHTSDPRPNALWQLI